MKTQDSLMNLNCRCSGFKGSNRRRYSNVHMPFRPHSNEGTLQPQPGVTVAKATVVAEVGRRVPGREAGGGARLEGLLGESHVQT